MIEPEADERQELSRRAFLVKTGATIAAGAFGAAACAPPLIQQGAAVGAAPVQPAAEPCPTVQVQETAIEVPEWPWPYAKLDPEDVRKRGHKGYYDGA